MNGLLIKSHWIELILNGQKCWEIRGNNTKIRGKIALIKSGTSQIVGHCEITDVIGPLTLEHMESTVQYHHSDLSKGLPYNKTYAWLLSNVVQFDKPIPYMHPQGAVIWVKLDEELSRVCTVLDQNGTNRWRRTCQRYQSIKQRWKLQEP